MYLAALDNDLRWTDAAWLTDAHSWIKQEVADCGWLVIGPIEQPHVRWWSTVLRVSTDGGVLWMKAVEPPYAFEVGLTPWLAAGWPHLTQAVIATDQARAWMLSRDAGVRLREAVDRPPLEYWTELLPQYAELQFAVSGHRTTLDALRVPDRTLATVAADLRAAIDEPQALPPAAGGLTGVELSQLRGRIDAFDADCRQLAELGIPETLQHDDLHDGNAFIREEDYVVFDWGDACISHPFHTMAVTLRALSYSHHWAPGGPEVGRLLDAYLEPWQRFATSADLHPAAEIARRTGTVARAMAYRGWIKAMPPSVAAEHVESIPYGLRLFLADAPWGTWDDGVSYQ